MPVMSLALCSSGLNIRAVLNSLLFSVHMEPPRVVRFCCVVLLPSLLLGSNCMASSVPRLGRETALWVFPSSAACPPILWQHSHQSVSLCDFVKFFKPRTLGGSHGPRQPGIQTLPWLPSTNPEEVWGKNCRDEERNTICLGTYTPLLI